LYDRKQSGPFVSERFLGRAIMARQAASGSALRPRSVTETTVHRAQSTGRVDNFVGKLCAATREPRKIKACNRLLKN